MTVSILEISEHLKQAIKSYKLPESLGFGKVRTPLMVQSSYLDGGWGDLQVTDYQAIALDPSSKVFHYGQAIFEGLKAYRTGDRVTIFRPDQNAQRFAMSARRLSMPELPLSIFMTACATMAHSLRSLIPTGINDSLYLRPVMIATEPGLGLAAAKEYLFYVIASPSSGYFAPGDVHVLIERKDCRAAPGGTGFAKAAGNYAGSLQSLLKSNQKSFQQNMWLDAREKKYIEELSGMNFFAVVNGELYTPKLSDSILPGITRNSLICLAKEQGLKVNETSLEIDWVIEQLSSGMCSELFACGTAAVITPIAALGEDDGTLYHARESFGPIAQKLRQTLVDLQRGRIKDSHGWVLEIAS